MNKEMLFEGLGRHWQTMRMLTAPMLAILIVGVYILVYMTGGIKYVYSHSMYIPIVLSGIVYGMRGGIIVGVLAGIVLGPFMPIVVATGEPQETINWLYRTGFFTLIGFLSGFASDSARSYMGHLKWLSVHDISTKLPNRSALLDRLSSFSGKKESSDLFILVAVSIENAMELKSAFGFAVIDEAIRQLASRFKNNQVGRHVYHTDTSQIAILLTRGTGDVEKVLNELVEVSQEPVMYNEIPIHIDMRMGNVTFNQVNEAPEVYLQRAEAALTVAYEKAQERISYNPSIRTITEENLSILGELKRAITERQLALHYQPKVAIATGKIHGAEALIRWNHPVRGEIPPNVFIPRAEQSTLIELIAEFALDEAIGQMVKWQQTGIDLSIAVNISPQNLIHPGFTDLVLRLLDRHGLSGDKLELEVTERALMLDMEHATGELSRLAGAKLVISIDDFGTGYSSLQYMHRLPISLIKIDQSFVRRLPNDKGASYIVDAAVTLAHKMGMHALAEGVENQEVYDFLGNIGCDLAQGFMISKPLATKDFEQWYAQHNSMHNPVHA